MAYPQVADLVETAFSGTPTDHLVNMPATVNAGDLLIILIALRDQAPTTPSGWTQEFYVTSGSTNHTACYKKVADGTEGGGTVNVTTSVGCNAAAHCYRITNWYGTLAGVESTTAIASDTNPNPPSETASWGALENLWLVLAGGTDDDATFSAYPTNYTNGDYIVSGGGTNNGAEVGSARRNLNAATDDPGTFTLSESEAWVAATLVIRQASNYTLEGVTRDKNGNTLGNCKCLLMKDNLDNTATVKDYTTSDGSGDYEFTGIADDDNQYFVYGWKDDTPHVFDVTDHDLLPKETRNGGHDLYLRSDVDKGETSPDKDLRLRSDADKLLQFFGHHAVGRGVRNGVGIGVG